MSTQKEIIHYSLFQFLAQTSAYIAKAQRIPAPSVRRVLSELVAAGRAKFTKRDMFGYPGYVAIRQGRRRAS